MLCNCQGTAERILNWGDSQASAEDANLHGVCGNPPPENFEILKLENATFIIQFFIFCLKLGGLNPPSPPRLRRPCCQFQGVYLNL